MNATPNSHHLRLFFLSTSFLLLFSDFYPRVATQPISADCILNETFCSCFVESFADCPVPDREPNSCFLKPCTGYKCVETCQDVLGSDAAAGLCSISVGYQIVVEDMAGQENNIVACSLQKVMIPLPTWVNQAPEYNTSNLVQEGQALAIVGNTNTDLTGFTVTAIGDINSDGFPDLAIGDAAAQRVYVIYGVQNFSDLFGDGNTFDLASINGQNGFYIEDGDNLGRGTAAGDVNGDNIPDVVVAAPFTDENGRNSGSVFVLFGVATGTVTGGRPSINVRDLNGNNGFRIVSGPAPNTLTGLDIVVADVNHDGIGDILIGSQRNINDNRTPDGFVVYGRRNFGSAVDLSALDGVNGFAIRADTIPSSQSTIFYIGAADFNADGRRDILIGNPTQNQMYVIYGRQQPFAATFLISSLNKSSGIIVYGLNGDSMGRFPKSGGDLNNDGIEDIIVSSWNFPRGYVLFGSDQDFPAKFNTTEINGRNGFFITGSYSFAMAGGGDVNGDGIDDLVLGASYEPTSMGQSGRVYGFYGKKQGTFKLSYDAYTLKREDGFIINGQQEFAPNTFTTQFGRFVDIGNLNQDNYSDILVGAPGELPKGAAYIFLGRPDFEWG